MRHYFLNRRVKEKLKVRLHSWAHGLGKLCLESTMNLTIQTLSEGLQPDKTKNLVPKLTTPKDKLTAITGVFSRPCCHYLALAS